MTDLQTLAALMLSSRITRGRGVQYGAGSLTSMTGVSRAEVHRRLRRYHGVDWTWERFAAAHAEMVERGGLRLSTGSRGGYKVASWDVMATLAQAVAA